MVRGTVEQGGLNFGGPTVAAAEHVADGADAQAYIRPHDVLLTRTAGQRSFPVSVERRTNLGWVSKLQLRLTDGQVIFAELPNEELDGIDEGDRAYASLRNAKVFSLDAADPPSAPGDGSNGQNVLHTSDEDEVLASQAGQN
jgi:ABC-type sulfate/molybdate transport systems ATPase subunit